jgi:hypothetical protein
MVLMHKGALGLAQDDDTIARCRPRTDSLNRQLLEQARASTDVTVTAGPVLGAGVAISRVNRCCCWRGTKVCANRAVGAVVDQLLKSQGQCVLRTACRSPIPPPCGSN